MTREIKFRAKSVNTGEVIESMTISRGTIKRKSRNYYFEMPNGRWTQVVEDTIVQFTGQKDKNGKDVYEHDLCKFMGNTYKICWSKEGMMFYAWAVKQQREAPFLTPESMDRCEVI